MKPDPKITEAAESYAAAWHDAVLQTKRESESTNAALKTMLYTIEQYGQRCARLGRTAYPRMKHGVAARRIAYDQLHGEWDE